MTAYDGERVARLISALPPAPEGWVRAAQQLPRARKALDEIVARATADTQFRAALVADLESTLAQAGYEPDTALLDAVRTRLSES